MGAVPVQRRDAGCTARVQRREVGRTARVRRRGGAGFDRIGDIDA
ncbi:hypothetical protein ABVG11_07675 [Streptomyces sp. HD1123-B1]